MAETEDAAIEAAERGAEAVNTSPGSIMTLGAGFVFGYGNVGPDSQIVYSSGQNIQSKKSGLDGAWVRIM